MRWNFLWQDQKKNETYKFTAITDHVARDNQVIGWEDTKIVESERAPSTTEESGNPFGLENGAWTPQ